MAIVNLIKIGQQLALTAKPVHAAIESTGNAVELAGEKLAGKIPELAKFKSNCVFRIYKNKMAESYECKTLTLYLDDNGQPAVFTADLKPLPGKVQFTAYKTGLNGFQRIKYEGVEFEIETSLSDEYRDNLVSWGVMENEGLPQSIYLADVPHITVPLKDLPKDVVFKVIRSTGTDKKFESKRWLIQNTVTKEEIEVFENADLRDMCAVYGSEAQFKIGNVVKKQGKKGENDSYFVKLIDLNIATFEDLAI